MTHHGPPPSPFHSLSSKAQVTRNALAFAVPDPDPIAPGHTLVLPVRPVASWFEASPEEQAAIFDLVRVVQQHLDSGVEQLDGGVRRPDGFTIGFDVGEAAGQTIQHLHVHVIPRYAGDVAGPPAGLRRLLLPRGEQRHAKAWLATGGEKDPFARHVLSLFDQAEEVAIVAAFVQQSGLGRIEDAVQRALARGVRIRVLTGDYLDVTQASALEQLLDWEAAARVESQDEQDPEAQQLIRGSFAARIVETATLPGMTRAFHPKSWRFEQEQWGLAFVGSSNLSLSALDTGIEWNLGISREQEPETFALLRRSFEELWATARPLEAEWIAEYAARARCRALPLPPGETEAEAPEKLPEPNPVQRAALTALADARAAGRRRALVVLATGLGKTLVAVLDYARVTEELGRRARLLFLAHRRELLSQAAATLRRLAHERDPGLRLGWCSEDRDDLAADAVFASVAKLARPGMLERLRQERFDYVVIDEVHHAAAASYRSILGALDVGFLLGLTATPERSDDGDVLGLFDDFVAHRADLAEGIARRLLVPFAYHGVRDDIDYANIPWRNKRFDPEALAAAAQTEARMRTLHRAWLGFPGRCTLVFCCSIAHAKYVRGWLRERNVRVAAVFSGPDSDPREQALAQLRAGELEAVCAVDVFNEGVDLPGVDRVVMLRPTESRIVFLQQLGRGLRFREAPLDHPTDQHIGIVDVFLWL